MAHSDQVADIDRAIQNGSWEKVLEIALASEISFTKTYAIKKASRHEKWSTAWTIMITSCIILESTKKVFCHHFTELTWQQCLTDIKGWISHCRDFDRRRVHGYAVSRAVKLAHERIKSAGSPDNCLEILSVILTWEVDKIHWATTMNIAVIETIKLGDTQLLGQLLDCITEKDFRMQGHLSAPKLHNILVMAISAMVGHKDCWDTLAEKLDNMILVVERMIRVTNYAEWFTFDLQNPFHTESANANKQEIARAALFDYCADNSFLRLATFLSSYLHSNDDVVQKVRSRKDLLRAQSEMLKLFVFAQASILNNFETCVVCAEVMPLPVLASTLRELTEIDEYFSFHSEFHSPLCLDKCDRLAGMCRDRDLSDQALLFSIYPDSGWRHISQDVVEQCHEPSVLEYVLWRVSLIKHDDRSSDFILPHLDRCRAMARNEIRWNVLTNSIKHGKARRVDDIMNQGVLYGRSIKDRMLLLIMVIQSRRNPEEMMKSMIRAGLSIQRTSQQDKAVGNAVVCSGKTSLLKLAHYGGYLSQAALFRLYRTPPTTNVDREFTLYLEEAATTPPSLQNFCFLQTSQVVGCHSGRLQRVRSLEVASILKEMLLVTCPIRDI